MTVVVGYADGEHVWMGCDTLAVNGWDQKSRCESKIVRRKVGEHECLLGVSGAGALIAMLRYDLVMPEPAEDLDRWAYEVARAVTRVCLDAKPDLTNETGRGINASVILGFAGRLWSLATNEAWPKDGWEAIGSGDEYAVGALYAVDKVLVAPLLPSDMICLAVQAACRYDLHCGGDFHIELA